MGDTPNIQFQKITNIKKHIELCKDFYTGSIKVFNEKYLPKWSGETDDGYATRVASTAFANMYAPIVDGLVGLVTKKEPTKENLDSIDLDNIDLKHHSIAGFGKEVVKKSLSEGIVFVSAETHIQKNRAFLKMYSYENLMSYVIEDNVLVQIVFKDEIEKKDGRFGVQKLERYIVFKKGGGEVWYKSDGSDNITLQDEWFNSLQDIPIVWFTTGKELSQFEIVPKMYDIANLNRVHLNLESNIANVLSVVGNPVPIFYGQVEEGKVTIGVKDALRFEDKQKEGFEYGEITGAGVTHLQNKIKLIEEQIDKTTFSILKKETNKTVVDAQQSRNKNTSFLTDVATELETKMNILIGYISELEDKPLKDGAFIAYKKDFDEEMINLEIAEKLLFAGAMSRETFYSILQTGELPKDFDVSTEADKIETDAGTGAGLGK